MLQRRTFTGGCHCGAVRFEVACPIEPSLWSCNCSICQATGFVHLIVAKEFFRLLSGSDKLTSYRFNTKVADHLFCSVCGIKSFYVPRSHPDGYSVDARCLDGQPLASLTPREFEGQDWEAHAGDFAEQRR
jgi:hypothetical protein